MAHTPFLSVGELGYGGDARDAVPNLDQAIGQSVANSASSLWLANGSNGVAEAAAASFLLVNTLMLLSASIVNVFT